MSQEREIIGEIIETSTLAFVAESQQLHQPPALGELIVVQVDGDDYCYGVVTYGTTSSPDVGRRVVRRATDDVRDEAIYNQHPQLTRLLQTTFRAKLVGWRENNRLVQSIPPTPPPLHHTVYRCPADIKPLVERGFYYFRLLLDDAGEVPAEHVLAAHVRYAYREQGQNDAWLERAAREIASLLKNDHERLMSVLYAIDVEV